VIERRRQRLLLAVLAVAAAAFAVTRLPSLLGPGDDGGPRFGGDAGVGEARVAELDVARLDAAPRDYEPGRDPFRYYDPPPKPPPPPPPPPPVEVVETPPPPVVDPGPQLPEIDLTYLGSFGPQANPIAVLTNGDTIHNAIQGEIVEGRFVVVQIGLESVDLGYVEFPDEPPARLAVGG
jgi:hypothetical protein